jgi:type II secretory pathway predicted ATPase ExeA
MNSNQVQNHDLNAYFGFLTEPFSKEIPAKKLFLTQQLNELFVRLKGLLKRRGVALITGEVGCGKSTAMRAFADSLDKTQTDWRNGPQKLDNVLGEISCG